MHNLLIKMIKFYQYAISPLRPPTCRFYPTCSHYACDALAEFGLIKGTWLTTKRLLRCHPWSKGGYDPIQK